MDISSKWTTFVEIAASFPVTELVQIPFPPFPPTTTITGRVYRGGRRTKARFSPSGAAALQRDTQRGGGEGWEKKTRDKKQTFPLFTKERFVRGPGRGGGWVCLIFRTQTRFTRVDARRLSCHAWNSRHNGVCSRFANRPNIRVVPGSCAAFTRCQKACEG